jgi:hypothetical protein
MIPVEKYSQVTFMISQPVMLLCSIWLKKLVVGQTLQLHGKKNIITLYSKIKKFKVQNKIYIRAYIYVNVVHKLINP